MIFAILPASGGLFPERVVESVLLYAFRVALVRHVVGKFVVE